MFATQQEQLEFCREFNITDERFRDSGFTWGELDEIAADYDAKRDGYQAVLKPYVDKIQACPYVHSLSYRVKDTRHLIEKIIRKNPEYLEKGDSLSKKNYECHITDLMGIRALVLFKSDWLYIHQYIMDYYSDVLMERPFAHIRQGDDVSLYKGKVDIRDNKPYRSVHYLVRAGNDLGIEIQVRTLYEEAWGEIDHKVRYPYNLDNKMVSAYIDIMNRLTGLGDEMGAFINEYIRIFQESKKAGVRSENEVYQFILDKMESYEDSEVKREIVDKIKQAENFREMKQFADLLHEEMRF